MMATVDTELESRLAQGLDLLGQEADEMQRAALLAYLRLLVQWNEVYNLTSVRNPLDMVAVHVLDSLSVVPLIDRYPAAEILDVGSGAGLPGIPLAIMRPAIHIHSVDAVAKKIGFQLQVKTSLKLPRFHPLHRRVEALTLSKSPDLVVSRAYAELATMLTSIEHLSTTSTRVLAMKGARPEAEIVAIPAPWQVEAVLPLDVPFLGAQRCAVLIHRVS